MIPEMGACFCLSFPMDRSRDVEPCWSTAWKELSFLWPVTKDLVLCHTTGQVCLPRHWKLPAGIASTCPGGWRGLPFPPKRKPPVREPVSRQGKAMSAHPWSLMGRRGPRAASRALAGLPAAGWSQWQPWQGSQDRVSTDLVLPRPGAGSLLLFSSCCLGPVSYPTLRLSRRSPLLHYPTSSDCAG